MENTGINVAYLSLGSNVGDRQDSLRRAIESLSTLGRVTAVSRFYETEPVGPVEQPWFLNCAVALETALSPRELLNAALAIEREMGRVREIPKGPRSIDIDILLVGDLIVSEPGLIVPHPAMHERAFVLEPLAEIAPGAVHPVLCLTVAELRKAAVPTKVRLWHAE